MPHLFAQLPKAIKSLPHYGAGANRCLPPPPSFRRRSVTHQHQRRKSKTDLPTPFLLTCPRRSLRAPSITPLFVLIEYLLAYLFLITAARLPVPRAHGSCTPAQLNPAPWPPPAVSAPSGSEVPVSRYTSR